MIVTLSVRCLGVQHATEAIGNEDFCNICMAFQSRVHRNRLNRAMEIDILSSMGEPSVALWAQTSLLQLSQSPSQEIPYAQAPALTPRSRSPSPQARRVKRSRQARDMMDFKAQMAQAFELLSRQQASAVLVEVPALIPLVPAPVPRSSMGAQAEPEPQPLMVEEDTLSIAASWGESYFPMEMEEGEELSSSSEAEPSSEVASEATLPPLPTPCRH
ncbi:UNVERIFIED_CONTAM: hypothetical protein FKN15_033225 [Acipenser sinensis]